MKIPGLCSVTMCRLASRSRRFEGPQLLHVQGLATSQLSLSEHKDNEATSTSAPTRKILLCRILRSSAALLQPWSRRHVNWHNSNEVYRRKCSKCAAEDTEVSAVTVQVVSASPCALRNMASLWMTLCGGTSALVVSPLRALTVCDKNDIAAVQKVVYRVTIGP
jgi:hypothetical protein